MGDVAEEREQSTRDVVVQQMGRLRREGLSWSLLGMLEVQVWDKPAGAPGPWPAGSLTHWTVSSLVPELAASPAGAP